MRSKWLLVPLLAAALIPFTGCRACMRGGSPGAGMSFSPIEMAFPKTPLSPPPGFIYDHIQAPLDLNYHDDVIAKPGKVGESKTQYVSLWILAPVLSFGWGDASVDSAAADGGIKEVQHVDYERKQILGVYSEFTIRAYGK